MKTPLLFSVCLLGLALSPLVSAETNVLYKEGDRQYLEQNIPFRFVFDDPMVSEREVGRSADEDFLRISPRMEVKTKWLSRNELEVTPVKPVPFRTQYEFRLGKDIRNAAGKNISLDIAALGGREYLRIDAVTPYERDLSRTPAVFLYSDENSLSLELFTNGYFVNKNESGKIPVDVHAVTVGDVDSLVDSWKADSIKRYLTEEQAKKKDFVIPYAVRITPRERLTVGEEWKLVIPSLGERKPGRKIAYNDRSWPLGKVKPFSVQLDFDPSGQSDEKDKTTKARRMELRFSLNVNPADPGIFFRDNLEIMADGVKAVNVGNTAVKELTLKGQKITFEPDAAYFKNRRQSREPGPDGWRKFPVLVKGDGVFLCKVRCDGVTAYDGQALSEDNQELMVEVKESTPDLLLDAGNNGVLVSGKRALRISLNNMDKIQVMGKKIAGNYGVKTLEAYATYYESNRSEDKTASQKLRKKFVPFEMLATQAETGEKSLDVKGRKEQVLTLDELFGKQVEPGMYFIEVQGSVSESVLEGYKRFGLRNDDGEKTDFYGDSARFAAQTLLQVTDLGLLWKTGGKQLMGYAYALSSGQPLESASLEFLGKDGRVLEEVKVQMGLCSADIPEGTVYLRLATEKDAYFTPFNDYWSSVDLEAYDVKTPSYYMAYSSHNPSDYVFRRVFSFTDRSLYRPGETLHLKGVIRGRKGNDIISINDKAFITIKNPREEVLLTREIKPSEYGTFDLTFKLPDAVVGEYEAEVYFPRNGTAANSKGDTSFPGKENDSRRYYDEELDKENRSFSTSIRVQEFKRNSFEVKSSMAPVAPGKKEVNISTEAVNYTGVPVAEGDVKWTLYANEENFYPENYREYRFGDYRTDDSGYWLKYYSYYDGRGEGGASGSFNSYTLEGEGKLDVQGKGKTLLALRSSDYPKALNVDVTSRVTNANEQSLRSSSEQTVHPAEVYVGLRENSRVGKAGEDLNLGLIAIGVDEKPYNQPLPVTIKVTRSEFSPTRYSDAGKSTVKNKEVTSEVCVLEEIIQPQDTQTAETGGRNIAIPAKQPGIYTVDVQGKDARGNALRSTSRYWVYGGDFTPWEYIDGLKIRMVPDKQLYKAGETARILIQTPVEGEAIVTVERENVLRRYQRSINATDSVVEVPIEAGDAPNVYVSVFLVKGAMMNSRQLKEPQLKLGYCELTVEPSERMLDVQMNTPGKPVLPGESMVVSGKVLNAKGEGVGNAEVTLFAEDEGVLDVIGYELPSPLRYFYDRRMLGVDTRTMLRQLLSEDFGKRSFDNKGVFIGGGAGGRLPKHLEDRLRKDFNPCALWLADLKTAQDGTFMAEFKNPDTLTRYRVMAVVTGPEASFGAGQSKYVVSKPVMLEPAVPAFASRGDTLMIPVSITATERKTGSWKISLRGNDGVTIKEADKVMEIPDSGNAVVPFEVTFNNLGKAILTWSIVPTDTMGKPLADETSARFKDSVEESFQVVLPAPTLKARRFFNVEAGKSLVLESLLPSEFEGAVCELTLKVSDSPMVYAGGPVNFLMEYPYGCLEQKTSKLIPWLYADVLRNFTSGFGSLSEEKIKATLQEGVAAILGNQNTLGSLNYWPEMGSRRGNDQFTQYAAYVLLLCRDRGVPVPQDSMDKLIKYLKTRKEPFSLLIQAKFGKLDSADMEKALDGKENMGYTDRLYLAMALLETKFPKARELADDLINRKGRYRSRPNELYGDENQLPLELMARTVLNPKDESTRKCFARFIAERTSEPSAARSTWRGGWDILALGRYLSSVDLPAEETVMELVSKSGKKETRTLTEKSRLLTFQLADDAGVELKCLSDKGMIYGELKAEAKPTSMKFEGVTDRGFTVSRVYEKKNGQGKWEPSHDFKVGDLVRVTLTVQKKDQAPARYLAIEDYVPSAFEPINPVLSAQAVAKDDTRLDYRWNSWVNHHEFHKESVRFFADIWPGNDQFQASYLARVTKAGSVSAPPAKAELMYMPEVYGLSPGEHFQITARP